MRRTVLWMGIANLVFFPFVFLYQVLFSFFSYADLIKREPDVFGTRKYSNYGRSVAGRWQSHSLPRTI